MRDYKEWTGQERLVSLKKTKEAIAAGIIPPPTKCNRCGKTTGRIDYHNHDYSDPVKYLEMLCQGCPPDCTGWRTGHKLKQPPAEPQPLKQHQHPLHQLLPKEMPQLAQHPTTVTKCTASGLTSPKPWVSTGQKIRIPTAVTNLSTTLTAASSILMKQFS